MFENGVSGTSVGDVQKEAQVSSSQLYHYFKEKRELDKAVIIYQTEKGFFGDLNTREPAWYDTGFKQNQKINQFTEQTLVAGIDIAKRKHYAFFVDDQDFNQTFVSYQSFI
jgi:AcrR family transcriptional regulator